MTDAYEYGAAKGNLEKYQCPCCGGPMNFDAASGNVICQSCGNSISVEAAQAMQKTGHDENEFDWGDYKAGLNKPEGPVSYTCESCGATIEVDPNTASTTCPYCGNNIVLSDRVAQGLTPNYIIPFKIDAKELRERLHRFYKDKPLLPKAFVSDNTIGNAKGIYVPFWLFDADVEGGVTMEATTSFSYREGEYDCVRTDHYLLEREGSMSFEKIPVDASTVLDDDLMDSLEPYDYSQLVPFNSAYLAGYSADRFDSDPDSELPRANHRMMNSATAAFASTGGHAGAVLRSNNLEITKANVKYAMLPVYVLNCSYGGKDYRYAVNGQTGKIVGELPTSRSRSFLAWLKSFAITGAVVGGALSGLMLLMH